MYIPDLLIVGSESLPGLAFGWSATQAYFRACCCHFLCPFLCFDDLEWVLGGAKNVVRLPPTIEILPETRCGCRQPGTWGATSLVPSRCRLQARPRRVRERQIGVRRHLRHGGTTSFSPFSAARDFPRSSRKSPSGKAGDLIP